MDKAKRIGGKENQRYIGVKKTSIHNIKAHVQ